MASKTVSTDLAFAGGAKVSGLPAGTATGQPMTQDQFGANSTQMTPTGNPTFDFLSMNACSLIDTGLDHKLHVVCNENLTANKYLQLEVGDTTRALVLSGNATLVAGTMIPTSAIGSTVQAYDADLAAIAALSSSGLIARTGAGSAAARTITLGSSLSGSNLDGVSGNPTVDTIQGIRTTDSPTWNVVTVASLVTSALTVNANQMVLSNTSGFASYYFNGTAGSARHARFAKNYDSPFQFAFYNSTNTSNVPIYFYTDDGTAGVRLAMLSSNILIGTGLAVPSGATSNLVFSSGSTSPVLGAATADVVTSGAVDNGAGNREWQIQPESGGALAYGSDTLRRIPNANRGFDDRIKSVTTTDATVTTVDTIPITASSTYLIETRITGRRTGGVSGTADDGCSYVRRGTYTTKAGTVTLMGAVETIGTDREDQAGFDATLTISGTNILVRVTGAASNNMSWQAHTLVERIAS